MISSDPAARIPSSETRNRLDEYEAVLRELRVIIADREKDFFPLYWLKTLRRAGQAAREFKPEIITVQAPDEWGIIGFIAARYYSIPLQIQIHTDIMSPWYRRASWKERARYHLARFLIPRADCLRVVSERIKRSLEVSSFSDKVESPRQSRDKFLRQSRESSTKSGQVSKVTVLPIFSDVVKYLNAVADPKTEERFHDYTFKMIAVGRFVDKEKNFSMLVEVMRDFVKLCPDALLVIVGDGPDRERFKFQVSSFKLEKNVILEPWRDDLPSFYKSFGLFLSSSNYEGWGRAVLEAMAAGLPVLMTDTGLAGEVVKNGENGVIVPVADKDAFLRELDKLCNNEEKRKRLGREARETARKLEPRTKEEYLKLYRETFIYRKV